MGKIKCWLMAKWLKDVKIRIDNNIIVDDEEFKYLDGRVVEVHRSTTTLILKNGETITITHDKGGTIQHYWRGG